MRRPHAIFRARLFGKPPTVLDVDNPRVDSRRELGLLPYPAAQRFDPHPRPVDDAEARRRFGVNFRHWIALRLAQLFDLAMLRVEKEGDPPAGREYERIVRGNLGRA